MRDQDAEVKRLKTQNPIALPGAERGKQQILINEMVPGTASDQTVRSAFSKSPVVRR